jgi:hypothetical protein
MSEVNSPVRDRSDRLPLGLGDQLVGAWALVAGSQGADSEGLLLVTPEGYAAVQLTEGDAPLAAVGRFRLDETAGTLTFQLPSAALAERLGAVHHVEIDGDRLSLQRDGAALTWRRAEVGPEA